MAYLYEHENDCKRLLGCPWTEIHQWLDKLFAEYGPSHRCHRHHTEGIEEVRAMWGDEAATAAKIHIIVDCWGIPSKADYDTGLVDEYGFTEESMESDVARLLSDLRNNG